MNIVWPSLLIESLAQEHRFVLLRQQDLSEESVCLQFFNTINKAASSLVRHSIAASAGYYLTV